MTIPDALDPNANWPREIALSRQRQRILQRQVTEAAEQAEVHQQMRASVVKVCGPDDPCFEPIDREIVKHLAYLKELRERLYAETITYRRICLNAAQSRERWSR